MEGRASVEREPRILFAVTADYSLQLLGRIPRALAKAGWDVHVASAPGAELRTLERNGLFTCHRLPMRRNPSVIYDSFSFFRWIVTLIRVNPDVVSIGTPKASLLGLVASWVLRVPARVYVLRGLRLESSRGFERVLLGIFERITAACATHIVSVSPSLRDAYVALKLARPEKVLVLGRGSSKGVNLQRFRPARAHEAGQLETLANELGLDAAVPVIGLVGRHHVDKGLEVFFEAMTKLRLRTRDFQVLVVGVDESNGLLQELVYSSGAKCTVLDERSDLPTLYRLMTVVCLPTQREGLPNVVLEALASGIPVVTTDATGAIDSVEDGVNGVLVAQGSSKDLAAALYEFVTNPALRESMALYCRPWVAHNFSEARVVKSQQHFYENLTDFDQIVTSE